MSFSILCTTSGRNILNDFEKNKLLISKFDNKKNWLRHIDYYDKHISIK